MSSKTVIIRLIRKTASTVREYPVVVDENGEEMEEYIAGTENLGIESIFHSSSEKNDPEAPLMLETKGVITEENDNISVTYETHLSDILPTIVTYSFSKSRRDVLTVKRQNIGESVDFYTTSGKSQWLAEDTKNQGDEITRFTKSLKNYITYESGGYIELEYFNELNGEMMEYSKEYFIVEPIK